MPCMKIRSLMIKHEETGESLLPFTRCDIINQYIMFGLFVLFYRL